MVCKICGHKTEQWIHPKDNTLYHYCHNCLYLCKDKSQIISLDEEMRQYNFHQNSLEDTKYVTFLKDFVDKAVIPFIGEKKGLDFGSGPTPVLSVILKRDYGCHMDIYDKFYAKEEIYLNQAYDFITATEVAEHLEDPLAYFRLFGSLLKEKGVLSLMTLFHPNQKNDFFDWWYIRDLTHISFFTPHTIRVIAKTVGLEVIYSDDCRHITLKKS